jgi:hypothetical protein
MVLPTSIIDRIYYYFMWAMKPESGRDAGARAIRLWLFLKENLSFVENKHVLLGESQENEEPGVTLPPSLAKWEMGIRKR